MPGDKRLSTVNYELKGSMLTLLAGVASFGFFFAELSMEGDTIGHS